MRLVPLCGALALIFLSASARALDKQGSAHGGGVEGPDSGVNVSGAASLGVSLYNPTYAARPDNSGLSLFRYALHADIDLIGRRLSIPIDLNMFTDREARPGARFLVPSEFDVITGVTSTWRAGPGAIEMGARVEHDRPLDRGGYETPPSVLDSQTYVDVRARYLYSVAAVAPKVRDALIDGDVSGWFTLGWFAVNPTYAARPDNTGLALFRYGAHGELSVWHDYVSVGLDATFFTDRQEPNVFAPSELDLTPELILRHAPFELHLAYERDMPIDRGGLVQQFVYVLAAVGFDLKGDTPGPLERKDPIPSP
jgi:hypothetical protein